MMHSVVPDLFNIVAEAWYGEKCNTVIGAVIRHPGCAPVPKLDLRADDKLVPLDHVIEVARLDRDVMKGRLDDRHCSSPRRDTALIFCLLALLLAVLPIAGKLAMIAK